MKSRNWKITIMNNNNHNYNYVSVSSARIDDVWIVRKLRVESHFSEYAHIINILTKLMAISNLL